MGGKALKVNTKRINKKQYEIVSNKIQSFLDKYGYKGEIIPAYNEKKSFGDIDVLLEQPNFSNKEDKKYYIEKIKREIKQSFFSRDFFKNGNVLSFDYRRSDKNKIGFQADFIFVNQEIFNTALNYFSYNDLGGFIGLTAKKMGLTYGHDGLFYKFYDNNNLVNKIRLTTDTDKILKVLGFDVKKFHKGFKNYNEIFDYIMLGAFFNENNYSFKSMNHINRVKNKKRESYKKFADYIEKDSLYSNFIFPNNKDEWLPYLFKAFPDFKIQYQQSVKIVQDHKLIKEVFNGKTVHHWTGLQNKELGKFMYKVRGQFNTKSDMANFIKKNGKSGIKNMVKKLYKEEKTTHSSFIKKITSLYFL